MPIVLKSGKLKLLEPSGPVQACNGIDFYMYSGLYLVLVHCGLGLINFVFFLLQENLKY